jgi:hypothetical protein
MVEPMSEGGVPIMDPKKLDTKDLMDRLQKVNTEMVEMRRNTDRKLAETAEKHRLELDRLRGTTANHIRDVEAENKALLRSLSRLQIESDALRNENIILKSKVDAREIKGPPLLSDPLVGQPL